MNSQCTCTKFHPDLHIQLALYESLTMMNEILEPTRHRHYLNQNRSMAAILICQAFVTMYVCTIGTYPIVHICTCIGKVVAAVSHHGVTAVKGYSCSLDCYNTNSLSS